MVPPLPASAVRSDPIDVNSWRTIDGSSFRIEMISEFTVDASTYDDLVSQVHQSIQARHASHGKHIPYALFKYYCMQLWWFRALWVHCNNGNMLTPDQIAFVSLVANLSNLAIPSSIAQYLQCMGNFLQGGEQYTFRAAPVTVGEVADAVVKKG